MSSSRPWYARAFDAPYLEVYAHRNAQEAERATNSLLEPLGLRGKNVLDLACGVGRYSRVLSRRGATVLGLDLSWELLRRASEEGTEANLLGWVRGDMLHLPLRDAHFDLVLSMFTSFGYMPRVAEDRQVLREMHRVLRPGGQLLLDLFNAVQVRQSVPSETQRQAGPYAVRERRHLEGDTVVKEIELRRGDMRHAYREQVRLWERESLDAALRQEGFCVTRFWGSYAGEPFDSSRSARLLVLAEAMGSPAEETPATEPSL